MIRTYEGLCQYDTFEDRFAYLKLHGRMGVSTFGFDRWINQKFYSSKEWRDVRDHVIIRDNGCDMAVEGRELYDRIAIHHMNPISVEDLVGFSNPEILHPDFLITVGSRTHNAIHYGDSSSLILIPKERCPGDTIPWTRDQ